MPGIEPGPGEVAGNQAGMSLKELRVWGETDKGSSVQWGKIWAQKGAGSCGSPWRETQPIPRAGEKGSGRLSGGSELRR